ncbi:MAG: Teichuronic acid biosynthesis protein TuaB [Pseudomonadota bacterium]|jgi:O-antigen/teichoic acid export membrane protein
MNGSVWAITGFGVAQVVRLISNILLAALLYQEAFALMAIVAAMTAGFALLSDIGLGPNIVQSKRGDDPDFLNTAWTIQVIRGVILAMLATAMAWPLASFYAVNDPMAWELRWLIPMVALGTLFEAFNSTKLKTASRHLNVGRTTVIQLSSQFTGIAVMVLLAWWTRSVYSMALGGIVTAVMQCALSHLALPGVNNRFRWEREAVLEIIHFGKWVLLSTMIYFFAMQIDKLVFGRVFPLSEVGVYSIAASLAIMTATLMGRLQGAILFPLFARLLDRKEGLISGVQRTKGPLFTIAAYMVALSIACAGSFVALAYDARYAAAGLYIPILAAGAWFTTIEGFYNSGFLASGQSRWGAIVNTTKLISFCILLVPAIQWGGLLGAVIAAAVSDAIKLGVTFTFARRIGLLDRRTELWLSLYGSAVGVGVLWVSRSMLPGLDWHPLAMLLAQGTVVTLAFAPLLIRAARTVWQIRR